SAQAGSVAKWASETFEHSVEFTGSTAQESARWVAEQFQNARGAGETTATNAKDWVMEDIERMGSWEYSSLSIGPAEQPERVTQRLNDYGSKRWECILVDSSSEQKTFYFKRPRRSYLKHIPAKELMRLVPLLGGGDEHQ
ncbi:MAG: hypothetical protein KDB27_36430, partial [Planctomycetales bacterium]|nr:hypothetical protein [Planctomycetales bacterium]